MPMMMNKKKDAAIMILAGYKKEPPMTEEPSQMDAIKLAAYEMASKAEWEIGDMDAFLSAFMMLHKYMHEYEESKRRM